MSRAPGGALGGAKRQGEERLLVLTRYPTAGRSKTRLIPVLGAAGAADLHRRLAERTIAEARAFCRDRGATLEVHFADADNEQMHCWLGADIDYVPQADGDLGARLAGAFVHALGGGRRGAGEESDPTVDSTAMADRVAMIIGTDCPGLKASILVQAFGLMTVKDLVLGPAEDGGYYLIALRTPAPALFDGIAWGGPRVLVDTLVRAAALELRVGLIGSLPDVDRPEDLRLVASLLPDDVTRRD